ncbi:unnamed protein product [Paramecium pentaurelia]|uniref:RING-type domain-containing protein n=1 Tax=Paramecium pentaurelia TaxID=43138 RepID=A0A8S1XUP1_9CILI|nr:unnamed protein product [Paramecium pentaurelia]
MSQRQFEITPIPSEIKPFSNSQKWLNVGQLLEGAMLVGLIEYHIKVNQVQIVQSIVLESNQNNSAMQNINNLLNNSKNKPNRFQFFIEQVKIQDPYGKCFKDAIKSYLKYNFKTSPSDQYQFLCDTFKVNFVIYEQPNQQKLYGAQQNGGSNKIIFYKKDDNYYLILTKIEKICAQCKTKLYLITLECQHFICYNCIKKSFEQSKQLQSFPCNYTDCKQQISREFYCSLKKEYEKNNCSRCDQVISSDNQLCLKCEENNQKQEKCSSKIENSLVQKYSKTEQNEQQQDQIQQNQLVQLNEQDKLQVITKSINQNNTKNVQMEIENKSLDVYQQCIKCEKYLIQNQLIITPCQHYYCKECAINLCKFRNRFMCQKCGDYIETDHLKLSIYENNNNEDQKCFKCKQIFDETLLFENQCHHYICASCLESLASIQQYLRCPQCGRGINTQEANRFFDKILNLKIEQTEQEQQIIKRELNNELNQQINMKPYQNSNIKIEKYHDEQGDKKENSQIKIKSVSTLECSIIQLDEPQNCSFCHSPFTEYNTIQYLAYCQDSRHFIGVCCIIFPLDCPQCQIKSLKIEKDSFKFQLPQNNKNYTNGFNQYI